MKRNILKIIASWFGRKKKQHKTSTPIASKFQNKYEKPIWRPGPSVLGSPIEEDEETRRGEESAAARARMDMEDYNQTHL